MQIKYSKKFVSEYKKLPSNLKLVSEKKELIFKKNPFDTKLRTHKLTGKLKDRWAFSIDYKHRIIIRFINKNEVWFLAVGTHNVYR